MKESISIEESLKGVEAGVINEFDFNEDAQNSVERYEEMIRNEDQYFFDAQAFEYIIDNYIEKSSDNGPINYDHV